ncbi:hypothetical protein C0033_05530 [Clostridium sp. chh4-2]|uniref:DUF4365 domain-containing protein n=1 Tax=Clostridium sp. chh4-2 TaxID=2067550 RepID=UPI000CCF2D68|nr:DUF4365 domain-containing protein [Clostridium sp. chh4-2]PNV62991.1 hypothetical protein C0033_05530 [Clostridium sp. chh4-2]
MNYNKAYIARLGVSAVSSIVQEELKWIFREQPKDDFGIDAYIEICDNGMPTGRLIAVQIKSGNSYFARKTTEGYIFKGNNRHLDYWLSYSLPVILVLYNHMDKKAIWTPITQELVKQNDKSWNITIPEESYFNLSSMDRIKNMVTPIISKTLSKDELLCQFDNNNSSELKMEGFLDTLNEIEKCVDIINPIIDSTFARLLKTLSYRIKVRLLTNTKYCEKILWMRNAPGIEVHCMPQNHSMLHSKFMIIDGEAVLYGSANLSEHSWNSSYEVVLASKETNIVDSYRSEFCQLWKESIPV